LLEINAGKAGLLYGNEERGERRAESGEGRKKRAQRAEREKWITTERVYSSKTRPLPYMPLRRYTVI